MSLLVSWFHVVRQSHLRSVVSDSEVHLKGNLKRGGGGCSSHRESWPVMFLWR